MTSKFPASLFPDFSRAEKPDRAASPCQTPGVFLKARKASLIGSLRPLLFRCLKDLPRPFENPISAALSLFAFAPRESKNGIL